MFAEMVGVVVGDEESFAEEVLAVAPAEGFVEIGGGVLDDGDEVLRSAWMVAMDWSQASRRREARGIWASSRRAIAWGGSRRWAGRRS